MSESIDKTKLPIIFYRFLISRFLTGITMTAYLIFYSWHIVSIFHSVFLSGMLITITLATEIVFSFPIGHLIDVFNNTTLNFYSNVIMILGFIILLFSREIYFIYAATAISVLGWTIKLDTFSAIIKKHLCENLFKKANSLNNVTNSLSLIIGTIIGGASLILLPNYFNYILLTFTGIAAILSIPAPEKISKDGGKKQTFTKDVMAAGSFIKKISGFLILAFFLNGLFISLDTYSSGLFNIVLKSSPFLYTIFSMSVPIGMIMGTPLANVGYFRKDRPLVIATLLLLFSPFLIILSISRSPFLDIFDALLIGIILPVINIPLFTRLMKIVPGNIYGKVMAFLKVFTGGASPVMGAIFSFLVIFASISIILLSVGILVIPLTLYGVWIIPRFFRLNPEGK